MFLLERKQATTYFHNAAGRVVRSEEEWTQRDVEMILALEDYEAGLCQGCGGDLAETTKPENQGRYVGRIAAVCHRCVARDVAADNNHPHPNALTYSVELKS